MDNLMNPRWWSAAITRCIRTFAQTFVGALGTNAIGITECDWLGISSLAAMAAFISLMSSLSGLPEVSDVAEPPKPKRTQAQPTKRREPTKRVRDE